MFPQKMRSPSSPAPSVSPFFLPRSLLPHPARCLQASRETVTSPSSLCQHEVGPSLSRSHSTGGRLQDSGTCTCCSSPSLWTPHACAERTPCWTCSKHVRREERRAEPRTHHPSPGGAMAVETGPFLGPGFTEWVQLSGVWVECVLVACSCSCSPPASVYQNFISSSDIYCELWLLFPGVMLRVS